MHRFSIVMMISLVAAACGKGGDGSSAKSAEGAKAAPTKLPALGLQIDLPGEVTVDKGMGGDDSVMVTGSEIGAMTIEASKTPQSLDDAKSDAKMYTPKNLKADALADGWAVTYENTGGAGANFFVQVRRDLGGKTYACSSTGGDADRAKAVLAACKTLRK
jgi:hypothetical protein